MKALIIKKYINIHISYLQYVQCTSNIIAFPGENEGEEVSNTVGSIGPTVDSRRTVIPYTVSFFTILVCINTRRIDFNVIHNNTRVSKYVVATFLYTYYSEVNATLMLDVFYFIRRAIILLNIVVFN